VLLVRTPSSPKLALRPDMVLLLTPSLKAPHKVLVDSELIATAITEESLLRTSCELGFKPYLSDPLPKGVFFYIRDK